MLRAPCMGRCDTAPVLEIGHNHLDHATPDDGGARPSRRATPTRMSPPTRPSPPIAAAGGYATLLSYRARRRHARRGAGARARLGPARPRRRRLPLGPQVVVRARRARAALSRGQRRRGRARHLQGPLLSRAHPAPVPRGHADRRLGGRGRDRVHLHARRVPGGAGDPAPRDRRARGRRASSRRATSTCAAARAPTSAAKNRR